MRWMAVNAHYRSFPPLEHHWRMWRKFYGTMLLETLETQPFVMSLGNTPGQHISSGLLWGFLAMTHSLRPPPPKTIWQLFWDSFSQLHQQSLHGNRNSTGSLLRWEGYSEGLHQKLLHSPTSWEGPRSWMRWNWVCEGRPRAKVREATGSEVPAEPSQFLPLTQGYPSAPGNFKSQLIIMLIESRLRLLGGAFH